MNVQEGGLSGEYYNKITSEEEGDLCQRMDVMVPDLVNEKKSRKVGRYNGLTPLSVSLPHWMVSTENSPSLAGCITNNLVHYNIERTRQVVCFGHNSC